MAKGEEFNHRNVIAKLYHTGNFATEIIKATGYAKNTIYHIVLCLKAGKEVESKLMIQEGTLNVNLMIQEITLNALLAFLQD